MIDTGHHFVFIGGLHRSGTSLVHSLLRAHPQMSGFHATGAYQDEGQHLQTVYPSSRALSGPGRFGFHAEARMTETSPLAAPECVERLFAEWSVFWDLSKEILVEKSPPNLIRTRFLQAAFPRSSFIVMVRHPLIVSLATRKWARWQTLGSLLDHWFRCYEIFLADAPHINALRVWKYEELSASPSRVTTDLARFLKVDDRFDPSSVDPGRSSNYVDAWLGLRNRFPHRVYAERLIRRFEEKANRFGYSLEQLDRSEPLELRQP